MLNIKSTPSFINMLSPDWHTKTLLLRQALYKQWAE